MAAKKKESKELVLHKHSPETMKAIVSIAGLASAFGEDPEATVTEENLDKAVEVLARVREANRKLEEVHKEAIKDIKSSLKPFDDEKKALASKLTKADEAVAARIIELYRTVDTVAFDRRMGGALGSTLTVVPNGMVIEVLDADAIPDEYILPPQTRASRVNTAAIAEVMKAGGKVAGIKATPKYYLTTRASETIKQVK